MKPVTGIEPAPAEWKSAVFPLNYTGVLPWKALSMAGLLYHFSTGVAPFEVVHSLGAGTCRMAAMVAGFRPPREPFSALIRGIIFLRKDFQ